MTDRELLDEVRRMRAENASPKAIARALGVRPAVIAPLVRQVAAEAPPPRAGELAGCWISPAWSRELLVERREGWDDVDLGPTGPEGIVLVLVARAGRRDRITVCGYLVDTFCLGVKNAVGPEDMRRRDLPAFVRTHFVAFRHRPCVRRSTWRSISCMAPSRSRPPWDSIRIRLRGDSRTSRRVERALRDHVRPAWSPAGRPPRRSLRGDADAEGHGRQRRVRCRGVSLNERSFGPMGTRSRRRHPSKGSLDHERSLLDAIADGRLDDHLTAVADAVHARQHLLRTFAPLPLSRRSTRAIPFGSTMPPARDI